MDVIDFDAINAELDLAPDITSALPTEEDIISDLLADIEQQSVDELELDTIEAKGVTSEGQANFLIRRYKRLKDTAQKINDTADEELRKYADKVNNWRDNELKSLSYQMDYIQAVLESYTKANITGKKKSIKMIEGTLAISKQQPKIEYNEEQLRNFLATIKDGENFLEPQEPKLLWGEFKKASNVGTDNLLHYGDKTVPGVVVTIRPDKFAIK
jgi:hypothetical protein